MKYFRMSYEEVVFHRSYLNLMLLNRAIPGFKPLENDDNDDDGIITNRDPKNRVERKKAGNMHANSFFEQLM